MIAYKNNKNKCRHVLLSLGLISTTVFAATPSITANAQNSSKATVNPWTSFEPQQTGHVAVQLGAYWGKQGRQQLIHAEGMVGDTYAVTRDHSNNILLGAGYFLARPKQNLFEISYGVNGFYLPKATVPGKIIQENLFTNLAYHYHLTNYPLYLMAKSAIYHSSNRYALTIDAGIGPNFMHAYGLQEHSLDNGMTLPNNTFSPHTSTTLSVTAGIGVKISNVFGKAPFECGYRFFYLGKGRFNKDNQVLNTLTTGNVYANAAVCTLSI